MSAKKEHYDVGALTMAGSDYKYQLENIDIDVADTIEEGAGIGMINTEPELVKMKNTVSFKTKLPASGTYDITSIAKANMLSLSVLSLGGNNILAVCESGTFTVSTTTHDVSAGAELAEWHDPGRTGIEWDLNLKIASTALFVKAMQTATAHNTPRLITLGMTIGGMLVSALPVRLHGSSHNIVDDGAQTQVLKGSSYGPYTSSLISSFDPILTSILTGTGLAACSLVSGANTYAFTDGTIIDKATFAFADKKLTSLDVNMIVRGLIS